LAPTAASALAGLAGSAGAPAQTENRAAWSDSEEERATFENSKGRAAPAKVAKCAKAETVAPTAATGLAALADLAGASADAENRAPWSEAEGEHPAIENEEGQAGAAAKVANPAKSGIAAGAPAEALAALAGLAGAAPCIENRADALAEENQNRTGITAKIAKPAKVVEAPAAPAWSEAEEERVAITEHDGGIPREWAEGFARLEPDRPPADVPPRRWRRFVDDLGRFLDGGFAGQAARLGWGPFELFGCDRDRPFARIDQAGLLWLLDGHRLAALSENTATIETRTGARQTFRREPSQPGRVLAWDLAQ
jgi:hypothetical protein